MNEYISSNGIKYKVLDDPVVDQKALVDILDTIQFNKKIALIVGEKLLNWIEDEEIYGHDLESTLHDFIADLICDPNT